MKKKIVYLVVVTCCFSFFSAGKQAGSNCDKLLNKTTIPGSHVKNPATPGSAISFEFSSVNYFMDI